MEWNHLSLFSHLTLLFQHGQLPFSSKWRITWHWVYWPLTSPLWPVGPNGGRWSKWAALHVGGELPDGERDREELGRYEAPVGLHLWPREAQHRLAKLQDPAHGAAHEPHQEPREDHRGLSGCLLYYTSDEPQWDLCLCDFWPSCLPVGDVWDLSVLRGLYRHPGRAHALRSR